MNKKIIAIIVAILIGIGIYRIYVFFNVNKNSETKNGLFTSSSAISDEEHANKTQLSIGSTVYYTPQGKYICEGKYSGSSIDDYYASGSAYENLANIEKEKYKDLSVSMWTVLNVNEDGTVQIIPTEIPQQKIDLIGAQGYNNGVKLLNELCSNLYSDSTKSITARSFNLEDYEKMMTPEALQVLQTEDDEGISYGQRINCTKKTYPLIYEQEKDREINKEISNTGLGQSEQTEWIEISNNETKSSSDKGTIYGNIFNPKKTAYKSHEDQYLLQEDYLTIIPHETFWIATRCCDGRKPVWSPNGGTNAASEPYFGLPYHYDEGLSGIHDLYPEEESAPFSLHGTITGYPVCPVVTVSSSQLEKDNLGNWEVKQ